MKLSPCEQCGYRFYCDCCLDLKKKRDNAAISYDKGWMDGYRVGYREAQAENTMRKAMQREVDKLKEDAPNHPPAPNPPQIGHVTW